MDYMTVGTTDIAMDMGGCAPFGAQVGCRYFVALQADFGLFGRRGGLACDGHAFRPTETEYGPRFTTTAGEVLAGGSMALLTPLLAMHVGAERGDIRFMANHALGVQVGEFCAGNHRDRDLHRSQ